MAEEEEKNQHERQFSVPSGSVQTKKVTQVYLEIHNAAGKVTFDGGVIALSKTERDMTQVLELVSLDHTEIGVPGPDMQDSEKPSNGRLQSDKQLAG